MWHCDALGVYSDAGWRFDRRGRVAVETFLAETDGFAWQ